MQRSNEANSEPIVIVVEPPNVHALETSLLLRLLSTTQKTSSSGSNETRLLTLGGVPRDGRGLTNVLVVTLFMCVSIDLMIPVSGGGKRTPP